MSLHSSDHHCPLEAAIKIQAPENADHELRKAYNAVIGAGMIYFWNQKTIPGVNAEELIAMYKHAYDCYDKGKQAGQREGRPQGRPQGMTLSAERWARAAKHLARAFFHEAKISYLEPRTEDLPYLAGASAADLSLSYRSDTTADLLDSLAQDLPPGFQEMPEDMTRFIARGREHLRFLEPGSQADKHELLRAERIQAAHEYGRVVECLALAYESEAGERLNSRRAA